MDQKTEETEDKTIAQVLDRWAGEGGTEMERMRRALLKLGAFEVDYGRVRAGGSPISPKGSFPMAL